jgi:hypothetical protein
VGVVIARQLARAVFTPSRTLAEGTRFLLVLLALCELGLAMPVVRRQWGNILSFNIWSRSRWTNRSHARSRVRRSSIRFTP